MTLRQKSVWDKNLTQDFQAEGHALRTDDVEPSGVAETGTKDEVQPRTSEVGIGRSRGNEHRTRTSLGILLVMFSVSVLIMVGMLMNFPELDE